MMRGPYYDRNGIKRGAWSKEEDERLRAYVERYGHSNWRQLPKHAGLSRCGKSCRLRWLNYLSPDVKHGNFTHEEDETIIQLHQQHGNKWSFIAERLPGRSDNEIKNHWHSHLKKHLECTHGAKSEFKMKPSGACKGETTKYFEPENPLLGFDSASSSNISERSPPRYCQLSTVAFGEEIYEEVGDFWTQPFVPENTYKQDYDYYSLNYAADGADADEYSSYLLDNAEFLCQVMQEFPENPTKDIV
ncbi:hypothetical protein K1719_031397 [Acacia pycnantha]|nr:hypothetical protein K1719_031397 [Acacia pycnantha]